MVAASTVPVWLVAALTGQSDLPGQATLSSAAVAGLALLSLAVLLVSREARPRA